MTVRKARLAALSKMRERRGSARGKAASPVDPWRLVSRRFSAEGLGESETMFAVANGYMGMRGTHDEGVPSHDPAFFLNGFHETWPIPYGEAAFGFATTGQTIVSAPDGSVIRLYVDEEPLVLSDSKLLAYERVLDMRCGVLSRAVTFRTARGAVVSLNSERLVSLHWRHLAAISYEVTLVSGQAELAIASELVTHLPRPKGDDDPRVGVRMTDSALQPVTRSCDGTRVVLELRTRSSGMGLACGMEHAIATELRHSVESSVEEDEGRVVFFLDAEPGIPARVTKLLGYHHAEHAPAGDLCRRVNRTLDRAASDGYERIAEVQRERLGAFWEHSDIAIEGPGDIQQAVRYNLFQVRQASARVEGHGIAAKGLTGRGYEGQYFWDTEIYVLPCLTYTQPHVARRLLHFRYEMLDAARRRARQLGHRGVLFPWRTISGEEASAYYAAGTAQYHINAAISYAVRQFVRVTGDQEFLAREGVEILVETARFWADLGFFSARRDGQFCIQGVTGPDEYSAVVDNNAYTNLMARENLNGAVECLQLLHDTDSEAYARVVERLKIGPQEPIEWCDAAERMFVPYDERAGVLLQDEHFLNRKPWDFEGTPIEKYPLLLHYHPLNIYRHQVIKQTDVVLATFLAGDSFSLDEKRRVFEYYDPLTTADSSLSSCVQSVMASEVGAAQTAYEYFLISAAIDLANLAGNVGDGIHVASCGGVWMALVNGFAGLRDIEGHDLRFAPRLPVDWESMSFRLIVRGSRLEVEMTGEATTYRLLDGEPLSLISDGEHFTVSTEAPVTVPAAVDAGGLAVA
ncbi:MAG TPA: glycosyl hydrolase family 65 protein [Solirubrobacteraceae bacterium]|nr:glycosyl hydrolase family 65 protein [Solirubrobacteraceae bacterium]